MRAGLYERVSQDRAQGRSVAEQDELCRAHCDRESWQIVATYVDNDRSASRHARQPRPDFDRAKADIAAGRIDVLVCWESSRLQRDLGVYVELRDLCHRHGVLWCYSGRIYDLSRTDDRFSTGLDALLAEREADVTRDRVMRSMAANAAKGRPHGKLLYGYRREYDPETRAFLRQIPDEETGPVVREIIERTSAGVSCYRVARDLNDRGVPAPRGGRWTQEQVQRTAVNPGYAGKRVHRGKVIGDAVWPPIADVATWHEAHRILTDPARKTMRDSAVRHLLSGIARCGADGCGAPLRVVKNRGYPSYMCSKCFRTCLRETFLDAFIVGGEIQGETTRGVLPARIARPGFAKFLASLTDEGDATAARAQAAELQNRLDGFYDAAAAGELSPGALARIEARLLPELHAAQEAANRSAPELLRSLTGPGAEARFHALELEQKREVIRALTTIRLLPVGRGQRTFRPERVEVTWR